MINHGDADAIDGHDDRDKTDTYRGMMEIFFNCHKLELNYYGSEYLWAYC